MTLQELRFHFSPSSNPSALFFKMKTGECFRVGPCWRGCLWSILGKHLTSSKAPHSWEEGLLFQGICSWLVFHKCFQMTKQGLSFQWSPWRLTSFFHVCCQGSESVCNDVKGQFQRHMRDLVCKVSPDFWPKHPLSGLFFRLFHKTWYKISVGFSRNQNLPFKIVVLPLLRRSTRLH